ncbi:phage antirepressor KilAC domain-containing protein (plasmid) [Ralstonia syzygii subsp. celebesensis]|uniref:phage antirepressor KilAC domain-containing protein n=1 Tax=Ralstonia syzygii TaxID=28097 RepID=UPI00387E1774
MNDIIIGGSGAALRMTSQEIAELVEKRHDNVKRTIETLANQGIVESPQVEEIPTATRPASVYVFTGERGKRDSIVVVAQLSPEFTARLVDRWQELESGAAALPKTLPEALRLAADLAELKAKAEAALAVAAPKAEALDRIAAQTDGAVCLRIAAKLLQVPEKKFLQFAHAKGFIFRNHYSHTWQGYSDKAKAGLLELKLTTVHRNDGSEKTVEQVLVTRAGLVRLAELIEKGHHRQGASTARSPHPPIGAR